MFQTYCSVSDFEHSRLGFVSRFACLPVGRDFDIRI